LVVVTEQLSLAVTVVLCGLILMLLLGTQILDWYWLVPLAVIGLSFVVVRVRRRIVSRYRVAQILDHRLSLSDSISTAWFLLTNPQVRRESIAELQIEKAEMLARSVEPAHAFPFTGRRAWLLAGALAAAGFGLLTVRYLVTSSLSLREALIPIRFEAVVERLRDALPAGSPGDRFDGFPGSARRQQAAGAQQNDAQRLLETPGSDEPGSPDPNGRAQIPAERQSADAKSGRIADNGDLKEAGSADPAQAQSGEAQSGGQNASPQPPGTKEIDNRQTAGNQSSSGLLNRMRDALSNLMAKMKQSEASQRQGESARASDEKKSGEQMSSNNEQGTDRQQSPANQQAREQQPSQGQGQTTEKPQAAQGSNANQSADKKGSDSQSGIGRQDGDKSIKEAEEQKAMGKLADIIGKRSASVTGDMTVETGSGKQQLQTRFTGRIAAHSDSGGEINRDEIPVELQPYVRAYMEQIRKQQQTKTQ
jgi:hypothetical protein